MASRSVTKWGYGAGAKQGAQNSNGKKMVLEFVTLGAKRRNNNGGQRTGPIV